MSKLGKFTAALALGLILSLSLIVTGAFAQSVNQSTATLHSSRVTAQVAGWRHHGWWRGCGCGCGCGCGGWWGGGWDGWDGWDD